MASCFFLRAQPDKVSPEKVLNHTAGDKTDYI